MGFLDGLDKSNLIDPEWACSATGRFNRLVHMDPEEEGLTGQSGVYVIWHGGVKPQWVYVGFTDDLAAAMHAAGDDEDIMDFEIRGGLFVTWALVRQSFQPGVVRFLTDVLKPKVENPETTGIAADPVPVCPPAYTA